MAIAGLLVPEEKSRCSQVSTIEMQVRGGKGYDLTEKNVNGLTIQFNSNTLFIPSKKFNMTSVKEKMCTINIK